MVHDYHHGDLRAALIDAALAALDRDGLLPSWRALARACGVSHAAPYRHFESMEDLEAALVEACFRRFIRYARDALRKVTAPRERLDAAIRAYLRFARRHPHWYGLMFGRIVNLANYPHALRASQEAFALLRCEVAACGITDPDPAAFILWAAHHGLADLFRRGLRPIARINEAAIVDGLLAMSLAYVHIETHKSG